MSWFRIDDTLFGHPKTRKVGLESIGLWSVSGAYSMAYKTDGFVPEWFVNSWPKGKRLAARLVDSGLWEVSTGGDGEEGYQFHDWADYQPLSDEIERDRERSRERQKAWRLRRKGVNKDVADAERDASVTENVTHNATCDETGDERYPVPSRPVPSRPDPTLSPTETDSVEGDDASGVAATSARRRRRLPDDWALTDDLRAYAVNHGADPDGEFVKFENHHRAKGSTMVDWGRAWRTWVDKSGQFGPRKPVQVRNPNVPEGW